jgi:multiple sugar transport system ATP-binding protein
MVFQNYALYPHMNVFDNMAFGLKLRKFKKPDIKERVDAAAKILGIENLLQRKPKELSGGQRQRVALGRAIVREPQVFLMDEPLSNLDAKLRVQMRAEITKLHQRIQTKIVYVTHDQTEAMTMADRIVVMKDGIIQQIGAPKEVYDLPNNVFVGGFIGSPAMNFMSGELENGLFKVGDQTLAVPEGKLKLLESYIGKEVTLGIRPEDIHDEPIFLDSSPGSVIEAKIDVAELMGAETFLYSKIAGNDFVARVDSRTDVQNGQTLKVAFDMNKVHFFDIDTEERIQ